MTLRRKIIIVNLVLLASLLAIAGVCLHGLRLQRSHVEASLREYKALQLVESAQMRVVAAKSHLHNEGAIKDKVVPQLKLALTDLRQYKAVLSTYDSIMPPEINANLQAEAKQKTRSAASKLSEVIALLDPPKRATALVPSATSAVPDIALASAKADQLAEELADLLHLCNTFMNTTQVASDGDLRLTTLAVGTLAVIVPLVCITASFWQYRRIMVPLHNLRKRSRELAAGDFSGSYLPTGDRELVELGEEFNRMAAELHAFYEKLQEMVNTKSKELVRSERLASAGYLAAGVAHEINNPLNIMLGYAELSLKALRLTAGPQAIAELIEWQDIIREESLRCKQITGKLLSLARGGSEGREPVSLTRVASEVATIVRGLQDFRRRKINVAIDPSDQFRVHANQTEMKQVILNLVVNSLEATREGSGEVVVDARRDGKWVELTVTDNGRGMTPDMLEKVFEPFFTDKRGAGEPGTGLGLSITHAIVTDHGGEIRAQSPGPGQGSRFIFRLPAVTTESVAAPAPTAQPVA
ncbi:MAG: zraS 4 [Phycisphaerales bacterium]|nr:zraS 4 [Phycisphaerales bacterium]MDB5353883.1 zraS 4 [Phycisphaerales bacterium]